MAAVLGLALTVSSIIVQLAATRFTPHITSLFFRARTNLGILGFFVTSSIYVLWVNFSARRSLPAALGRAVLDAADDGEPAAALPVLRLRVRLPRSGEDRRAHHGRRARRRHAAAWAGRRSPPIAGRCAAVEAVEHLANIGLNALQQKDKGIASEAVDSLCELGIRYGETKAAMRQEWHRIPEWNRQSPDFVSLSRRRGRRPRGGAARGSSGRSCASTRCCSVRGSGRSRTPAISSRSTPAGSARRLDGGATLTRSTSRSSSSTPTCARRSTRRTSGPRTTSCTSTASSPSSC